MPKTKPTELELDSVKPLAELNWLFDQSEGWVGADGAYSIRLSQNRTLWTFGDTWIGAIKDGKRVGVTMINNSVAQQVIEPEAQKENQTGIKYGELQFAWDKNKKKPGSLWRPKKKVEYYWPADGCLIDGKLYVFLHRIATNLKLNPPFQFETRGDDLIVIENPQETPCKWQSISKEVKNDPEAVHPATACFAKGDYLYVYCTAPKRKQGYNAHPLIIGRLSKESLSLLRVEDMEYFVSEKEGWNPDSSKAEILFADAGPEMSVGRVKGIEGLVAVYMPPFSKEIMVRRALKPEGPWSERTKVFDCPEIEDSIILYSAKGHSELCSREKTLVVTYCRNTKDMESHFERPSIYFPRALLIKFK